MCSKIAAHPNNRHAVIDTSDSLTETAEIDSITLASSALGQDEGPRPREHISLRDRIIHNNPDAPCQRGVLLRKPAGNPNETLDQSLPRPKNRSVRVGKKSVYGTEDSHGNIFGIAKEYCRSDLAATQDDNQYLNQPAPTNEWGGDTLVASQAQKFIDLDRMPDSKHSEDSLLVPRKRVSPGKRSRGSFSLAQTLDKESGWQHGDCQDEDVTSSPATDLDMAENNQDLAPSDLGSDLSSCTILLKPTKVNLDAAARQQDCSISNPTPEVDITSSQDAPSTAFKGLHKSPWNKVTPAERIATRKSWRSPCQEDFSLKSDSRKRIRRSLDAALTGRQKMSDGKCLATARSIQQEEMRRIRSRSLSQPIDLCRKESEARTRDKSTKTKHMEFVLGRASGQKIKGNSAESILPTTARTSTISEDSIDRKCCPPPTSELPPVPQKGTLHGVAVQHRACRSDKSQGNVEEETKVSLSDNDSFSPSLDLDQSDKPVRPIPRKTRVPTSPDISDRPWIRREIPSSKYFPEDVGSPGRAGPMRQPFWIKYRGKLIICFPTNVNPGSYEVEIVSRIWLSKADKSDWLIFRIPGLPYLEKPEAPGRLSFSLTTDLRYQIDRSLLQKSYTCGPLAMGSSRFGPSPLVRLHREVLPSKIGIREDCFSPSDLLIYSRRCKVLESLSLKDGAPHDAMVLWLLEEIKNAMYDRRSEDPFGNWFAKLDLAQLGSAMAHIMHQKQMSPSVSLKDKSPSSKIIGSTDLSNQVNQTDSTTQNDGSSTWANGKISLTPAYFAGLFTAGDPLKSEDLAKVAWNFAISVTRSIDGKVQCRLMLEFPSSERPLLTVDGRDWLPNFATINGKVATQKEWRETEDGDLSLHHVNGPAASDTIKTELHFQEHTFAEAHSGNASRKKFRLPNVVDKVILGGTLTCSLDNTIITLAEPNCEDVFWRTDSLAGQMSTALPKLHLGYKMYMAVGKGGERAEDDLESLPDMQTVLDLASPTPPPRHSENHDTINSEGPAMRSQTSLASSSQDGVQSAETDLVELNTNRTAEPVRQGTARVSLRRLMLYLVIAFLLFRFHLRLSHETLMEYDAQAESEQFPDGMDSVEEQHEVIGTDGAVIEAMHGRQQDGDVGVLEADAAPRSDRGGTSWRDVIDHALGWQQLEG